MVWRRLTPVLNPSEASDRKWPLIEPHLATIEEAVAKVADGREVATPSVEGSGVHTAKIAVKSLVDGVVSASDEGEALDRLALAGRVARSIAMIPTLLTAVVAASMERDVIRTAGERLGQGLTSEGIARLREIEAGIVVTPWRELVQGEIRYQLGFLEARPGPEREQFAYIRRMYRRLERPGEVSRAQTLIGPRLVEAILAPAGEDELMDFARAATRLEPPIWWMVSPDPLRRSIAQGSRGVWPRMPYLYRGIEAWRRLLRLAMRLAELPPDTRFASATALRDSLGEEGRDPNADVPIYLRDEGDAWVLVCGDGLPSARRTLTIRLPRPRAKH